MLRLFEVFRVDKILLRLFTLTSAHAFTDYFRGVEHNAAVQRLFGDGLDDVLRDLKVQFSWAGGYMGVNPSNGHLLVNPRYLRTGDRMDVYLDIIHELVHVRQWRDGQSLFGGGYTYVERPTEIEAYRYTVDEAQRLGLSDTRICRYLKTEWMSDDDWWRLANTLGIDCSH
jgi:hypothetical protein